MNSSIIKCKYQDQSGHISHSVYSFNKKVNVRDSGLGNEPSISLNSINSFLLPQIHFKNGNIQKITKLNKSLRNSDLREIKHIVPTGSGTFTYHCLAFYDVIDLNY